MSKLKKHASKFEADYRKHEKEQVVNYMDGISYTVNPLLNLEMVASSSIFGEPKYYENGTLNTNAKKFVEAIDASLDYDFKGTLELAVKLRKEYFMRLNPAVICVRASMHRNRKLFNEQNGGFMSQCLRDIINIPTDIWNQFESWMMFNKTKNHLPNILKRTWAKELEGFSRYQLAKYKTTASIIDLVRICHANNKDIDELMKSGNIVTKDEEKTWETLRASGKSWLEILQTTYVPHMALLRNLRGIFIENHNNYELVEQVSKLLLSGVENGKQFPFRYYSAIMAVSGMSPFTGKNTLLDTLNMCLDKSMCNFPKLSGKTACLSDNSGSAWGTFNSEYGSVTVAEIGNLSSFITAINSDQGEVFYFGDRLGSMTVSNRDGVLTQVGHMNTKYGKGGSNDVGGGTENGIWIFFRDAIKNKTVYDNIFIYSDMQAGHGGLYGLNPEEYRPYVYGNTFGNDIDVLKLVQTYRKKVNPKVNVFSVQTAGYDNSVLPENEYRTSILTGWTGKEVVYAKALNSIWDKVDSVHTSNIPKRNIRIKMKKLS